MDHAGQPLRHRIRVMAPSWGSRCFLSANDRRNEFVVARLVKDWRSNGYAAALVARLPGMQRVHVTAVITVPGRARRDVSNYMPTVKAIIDGFFVDGGVLPDDNDRHMVGPDPRPGGAIDRARPGWVDLLIDQLA